MCAAIPIHHSAASSHVYLPARRPGDHRRPARHGDPDAEVGRRRTDVGRQPVGADVGARRGGFPDALDRGAGDAVRRDVDRAWPFVAATRRSIDGRHLAGAHGAGAAAAPATGAGQRRRAEGGGRCRRRAAATPPRRPTRAAFRSSNNRGSARFRRERAASALAHHACSRLSASSHGAVYFHHRRRGLVARQRPHGGLPRSAAAGARLPRPHPQVRSLSERRSGHDEPVSARRGLCDRRRCRDRSRPRPLRALHRRRVAPVATMSPRAASIRRSSPRSGAATIWARRCR